MNADHGDDRLGAGWLVLLLPVLCCGGPLLIGVLAATGAVVWGALGVVVAVVVGVVLLVARRRAGASCATDRDGSLSPSVSAGPARRERL